MIPHLTKVCGKGLASKGIHSKILSFIPREYAPILRQVSNEFKNAIPEDEVFDRNKFYYDCMLGYIRQNDIVSLRYVCDTFDWNPLYVAKHHTLLEHALRSNACIDIIMLIYEREFMNHYCSFIEYDRVDVIELLFKHHMLDLWKFMDNVFMYAPVKYMYWILEHFPKDDVFKIFWECLNNTDMKWERFRLFLAIGMKLKIPITSSCRFEDFMDYVSPSILTRTSDFMMVRSLMLRLPQETIGVSISKSRCDVLYKNNIRSHHILDLLPYTWCECGDKTRHRAE